MGTCSTNGQRQTTTPNHETATMWETKLRMEPQKTSRLLIRPEQVTKPNPWKLYDDEDELYCRNRAPLWENVENTVEPNRPHNTIRRGKHAIGLPDK
jgi:hypothetical protein